MKQKLTLLFIILLLACGINREIKTASSERATFPKSTFSWWPSQIAQTTWLKAIACTVGAAGLFGLWYWRNKQLKKKAYNNQQLTTPPPSTSQSGERDNKDIYATHEFTKTDTYTLYTINDPTKSNGNEPNFYMYKQTAHTIEKKPFTNIFLEQEAMTGIIKGLRYSEESRTTPLVSSTLEKWKKALRIPFPKEAIILNDIGIIPADKTVEATVYFFNKYRGDKVYTPRYLHKLYRNSQVKSLFLRSSLAVGPDTPLVHVYCESDKVSIPEETWEKYIKAIPLLTPVTSRNDSQQFMLPYYLFCRKNEGDVIEFYVLSEDSEQIKICLTIGNHGKKLVNYKNALKDIYTTMLKNYQDLIHDKII